MPDIIEIVRDAIRTFGKPAAQGRIIAAVSGGPDSVCLVHVLKELGFAVEIAHLDHETRGGASAEDAAFVGKLAERLGAPFHLTRLPVEIEAQTFRLSFEEVARQARYGFFCRVAKNRGIAMVATGHTADDQAETVLMRLIRGAAPGGLSGIPLVTDRQGVTIIRPLLALTRAEVEHWLETRKINFRADASNLETRFVRNRVRNLLIPMIEREFNPRVREALSRFAELERCEDNLLHESARNLLSNSVRGENQLDREKFRMGHEAVQRRALRMVARTVGIEPDSDRIVEGVRFLAGGPSGKTFELGGGIRLCNGRDVTEVVRADQMEVSQEEIPLSVPGRTRAFGLTFEASELTGPLKVPLAEYCSPRRQVFDAERLAPTLILRHRRPADRFIPLGMKYHRKLKDYFGDLGLTLPQRGREVLVTSNEKIVWIVGRAMARSAAVTTLTRRLVEIRVVDETGEQGPASET